MDLNGTLMNSSNSTGNSNSTDWGWQQVGRNYSGNSTDWIDNLLSITANWGNMSHESYDPECYLANYFSYRKLFYATAGLWWSIECIKFLNERYELRERFVEGFKSGFKTAFKQTEYYNRKQIEKHREGQKDILAKVKLLRRMDQFYNGSLTKEELLFSAKSLSVENKGLEKYTKSINTLIKEFPKHNMMNSKNRAVGEWIEKEKIIMKIKLDFFNSFTESNDFEKKGNKLAFLRLENLEEKFNQEIGEGFIDRPFDQLIIDYDSCSYDNQATSIDIEDTIPLVLRKNPSRSLGGE